MHGEKKEVGDLSSEANASSCVGPEAVLYCCSTLCSWLAAGFLESTATAWWERKIKVLPSKPCPDLLRKDGFSFPLVLWVRGAWSVFRLTNWIYSCCL